jgi:hypothetical protein
MSMKTVKLKQSINGTDLCLTVRNKEEEAMMLPCGGEKSKKWKIDRKGRIRSKKYPEYSLVPNVIENNSTLVLRQNMDYSWFFSSAGQIRIGVSPFVVQYDDGRINLSSFVKGKIGTKWEIEVSNKKRSNR